MANIATVKRIIDIWLEEKNKSSLNITHTETMLMTIESKFDSQKMFLREKFIELNSKMPPGGLSFVEDLIDAIYLAVLDEFAALPEKKQTDANYLDLFTKIIESTSTMLDFDQGELILYYLGLFESLIITPLEIKQQVYIQENKDLPINIQEYRNWKNYEELIIYLRYKTHFLQVLKGSLLVKTKKAFENLKKAIELTKILPQNLSIAVDTREKKNNHIISYFEKNKIPYFSMKLDVGDYRLWDLKKETFANNKVVERKANLNELSSNLIPEKTIKGVKQGRFYREMTRNSEQGLKMALMIEDKHYIKNISQHRYRSRLHPRSFFGLLNSLIDQNPLVTLESVSKESSGWFIINFLTEVE